MNSEMKQNVILVGDLMIRYESKQTSDIGASRFSAFEFQVYDSIGT